jgi:hypothetical protein
MKQIGAAELFEAQGVLFGFAKHYRKPVVLPARENCGFVGLELGHETMPPDVTGLVIAIAHLTPTEAQEITDFIVEFEKNRLARRNN